MDFKVAGTHKGITAIQTVSYTHLDVYKRQAVTGASSPLSLKTPLPLRTCLLYTSGTAPAVAADKDF